MEVTFSYIGEFTGIGGLIIAGMAYYNSRKSLKVPDRNSVFTRQLDFAQKILDITGDIPSVITEWYSACHFEHGESTIQQKRNQFHDLIIKVMGIQIQGTLFISGSLKPPIDEFVKTLTDTYKAGLRISESDVNTTVKACITLGNELKKRLKIDTFNK